jgi:plasmid stabilization system protein ParE
MARLIIQPRAQLDIDEAVGWYHSRDPALAERLFLELDVVFERISQNPSQFPSVADLVQRALLRKFPYSVAFDVPPFGQSSAAEARHELPYNV